MMSPSEHKAFSACLCGKCGGLTKVPEVSLPSSLLRWCICVFEESAMDIEEVEEKPKVSMGFVKAKKDSG